MYKCCSLPLLAKNNQLAQYIIENKYNDIAEDFDEHGIKGEPSDEGEDDERFHQKGRHAAAEEEEHFLEESALLGTFRKDPNAVGDKGNKHGKHPRDEVAYLLVHSERVVEEVKTHPTDRGCQRAEEEIQKNLTVFLVKRVEKAEERERHNAVKNVAPPSAFFLVHNFSLYVRRAAEIAFISTCTCWRFFLIMTSRMLPVTNESIAPRQRIEETISVGIRRTSPVAK